MASITFKMPDGASREVPIPQGMDPARLEPQHIQQLFQQTQGQGAPQAPGAAGPPQGPQAPGGTPGAPQSPSPGVSQAMPLPQVPADALGFLMKPDGPVQGVTPDPEPYRGQGPLLEAANDRTFGNAKIIADPNATAIQKLGAAGELALYATQPALLLGGTALEGTFRALGASKDTAAGLSRLGEATYGLAGPVITAVGRYRQGQGIIEQGTNFVRGLPRALGVKPTEAISDSIAADAKNVLTQRNKQLGEAFDAVETDAMHAVPTIAPGHPGWDELNNVVYRAVAPGTPMPTGKAGAALAKVEAELRAGNPVPMEDVIDLRKQLRALAGGGTGDPAEAAVSKFAAELHGELTDAYRTSLPGPLRDRLVNLQDAWKNTWVEPRTALASLYSAKTSSIQAFNQVFNLEDPRAFRAVANMIQEEPGLQVKLRAGFIDSLRMVSDGFKNVRDLPRLLDSAAGPLSELGVMNRADIVTLQRVFQAKDQGTFMSNLGRAATYVRVGGAAAAAHWLSRDPWTMVGAAVASGAIPELRKVTMLAADTPAFRRAALNLGTKIAAASSALQANAGKSAEPEEVASQRNLFGGGPGLARIPRLF